MILLWAIILGLLAGIVRAYFAGCHLQVPMIRGLVLVIVAFVPQLLAFYAPITWTARASWFAPTALVTSQFLLLFFIWLNRNHTAFWWMGAGLLMNLAVIFANGGLMPISPDTILRLSPELTAEKIEIGSRLGNSKDIILTVGNTRLIWFSDRFIVPDWYPQRVAFSLGDVLIAVGAFSLFWQSGRCQASDLSGKHT